ncbi:tRNA glutamyl-Q(34) synthetase GluQRS [Blastococcus sp. Marseille-P5729]|uniref:tRNA glutamyl-Q(34) synthetase GluQRS n=1 Tax=Blastococcus sp. Marseille-P5729 TaxID=2086582 RepID=UPI000D10B002|nr:tRNA glutamyl-Q(34) synthetase GluQRS [Blastococcus sp. Marseille-P5729]
MPGTGRFAPSPSGELHVGNLRTAALAWLTARSTSRAFLLRIEDLDEQRSRPEHTERQIADLRAIGLDWDHEPVWQSTRLSEYRAALEKLAAAGHTYECYCTRKEIREAQSAPHGNVGRYPGTCRDLTAAQRAERRDRGRPPAIRLRGQDAERSWEDLVMGRRTGVVDDVVLCRWDGALAYNLAVVVDDVWQKVDQVVRGDDLADQTATQIMLTELLSGGAPSYGHVPLVVNAAGQRLAKRDGAVTLADLAATGVTPADVVMMLLGSFGDAVDPAARTLRDALPGFDLQKLPGGSFPFEPPGVR